MREELCSSLFFVRPSAGTDSEVQALYRPDRGNYSPDGKGTWNLPRYVTTASTMTVTVKRTVRTRRIAEGILIVSKYRCLLSEVGAVSFSDLQDRRRCSVN